MDTKVKPIELKTFKNREGRRLSRGPDEGFIVGNNLVMFSKDTGRKAFTVVKAETPMVGSFDDGEKVGLTELTLFIKRLRKLLQLILEKTGTFGTLGETIEFMVSMRNFEFLLLIEMRIAK